MELKDLIIRIDALKATIDSLRPLSSDVEGRILQKLRLDWNYHSSNIEGNALTYGETKTLLLHGLTVGGKPLRDYLEVRGHNDAIFKLEDIVRGHHPLTEHAIREMHQLILGRDPFGIPAQTSDGIMTERIVTPGRYKLDPNHVRTATGEMFYFSSPESTPAEMRDLLAWYNGVIENGELHPLVIGTTLHYRFIRIHPFDDGNGRIARILMNLVFMKFGYPPAIIRTEEKESYYRALRIADGGDIDAFITYVGEQLLRSCEIYLRGARGEGIDEPEDIDRRIALFKAEAMKEKELLPPKAWTGKTSKELFDTVLYPIIDYVRNKLSGFDELFTETKNGAEIPYSTLAVGKYVGVVPTPESPLDETPWRFASPPRTITITFQWRGYRHAGINAFDVAVHMVFEMKEFTFSLSMESGKELLLSKRYDQAISKEELADIANWFAGYIMREITSRASASPQDAP